MFKSYEDFHYLGHVKLWHIVKIVKRHLYITADTSTSGLGMLTCISLQNVIKIYHVVQEL